MIPKTKREKNTHTHKRARRAHTHRIRSANFLCIVTSFFACQASNRPGLQITAYSCGHHHCQWPMDTSCTVQLHWNTTFKLGQMSVDAMAIIIISLSFDSFSRLFTRTRTLTYPIHTFEYRKSFSGPFSHITFLFSKCGDFYPLDWPTRKE